MKSARMLVHTATHMPFIEDHLFLSVGDMKFEIFIRELEKPSDGCSKRFIAEPTYSDQWCSGG